RRPAARSARGSASAIRRHGVWKSRQPAVSHDSKSAVAWREMVRLLPPRKNPGDRLRVAHSAIRTGQSRGGQGNAERESARSGPSTGKEVVSAAPVDHFSRDVLHACRFCRLAGRSEKLGRNSYERPTKDPSAGCNRRTESARALGVPERKRNAARACEGFGAS